MGMPEAFLRHQSRGRLRLCVPARRGDAPYFSAVVEALAGRRPFDRLQANPLTGSLLCEAEGLTLEELVDLARQQGLFAFKSFPEEPSPPAATMERIVRPVAAVDRSLRALSGGRIDLPSGVFFGLVAAGLYQLLRGQAAAPPWYTAFWYALGLFTIFAVDKAVLREAARRGD